MTKWLHDDMFLAGHEFSPTRKAGSFWNFLSNCLATYSSALTFPLWTHFRQSKTDSSNYLEVTVLAKMKAAAYLWSNKNKQTKQLQTKSKHKKECNNLKEDTHIVTLKGVRAHDLRLCDKLEWGNWCSQSFITPAILMFDSLSLEWSRLVLPQR